MGESVFQSITLFSAPIKNGGGELPSQSSPLTQEINRVFGSYDKFISEFSTRTAAIQGSGWGWLGVDKQNKNLRYLELPNQEIPELNGLTPILSMDEYFMSKLLMFGNMPTGSTTKTLDQIS